MVDSVEEPAQQEQPRQQVLTRWIGVVSIFVAPTTIVTGLCFYFGYVSTRAYLAYFGVDSDAVGFSTGDYMLKSVSVLYPPLVTLLLIWAVALWGGEYARRTLKRGRHLRLVRAGRSGWVRWARSPWCVALWVCWSGRISPGWVAKNGLPSRWSRG